MQHLPDDQIEAVRRVLAEHPDWRVRQIAEATKMPYQRAGHIARAYLGHRFGPDRGGGLRGGPGAKIPDADKAAVADCVERGLSRAEVAAELKMSNKQVEYIAHTVLKLRFRKRSSSGSIPATPWGAEPGEYRTVRDNPYGGQVPLAEAW